MTTKRTFYYLFKPVLGLVGSNTQQDWYGRPMEDRYGGPVEDLASMSNPSSHMNIYIYMVTPPQDQPFAFSLGFFGMF